MHARLALTPILLRHPSNSLVTADETQQLREEFQPPPDLYSSSSQYLSHLWHPPYDLHSGWSDHHMGKEAANRAPVWPAPSPQSAGQVSNAAAVGVSPSLSHVEAAVKPSWDRSVSHTPAAAGKVSSGAGNGHLSYAHAQQHVWMVESLATSVAARAGNAEVRHKDKHATATPSCKEETQHTSGGDSSDSKAAASQVRAADTETKDALACTALSESNGAKRDEDNQVALSVSGQSYFAQLHGRPTRPPCSCGVMDAPCLYRWNVQPGEVRFECSICGRVLGGNSSNSHLHMLKEHGVDDPCVVWLDTGKSTHRKHRSLAGEESKETAVRRSNPKSNGKSTCSPACWERLIQAVLDFYRSRSRRPNEAIFDQFTPAEQYCDVETHRRSGTVPPTAKTVQGKWAAIREHLIAGRSTVEVAGSKAAPLYCWLLDVWARQHPEDMEQLRALAGGVGSKPQQRKPQSSLTVPAVKQEDESATRQLLDVAVRTYNVLLYWLSVTGWVGNNVEWRKLSAVSSSVIDPALLLRLRPFPFVLLTVLCQSTAFEPQPMSASEHGASESVTRPGGVEPMNLALRLVGQSGILQLSGGVPSLVSDILHIQELVFSIAHKWLSVFGHVAFMPSLLLHRLTDQELQQSEAYMSSIVARPPALVGLEAAITTLATKLGVNQTLSVADSASPFALLAIRMDNIVEKMQICSQGWLRLYVWERCRHELISTCRRAKSHLQAVSYSSHGLSASEWRLVAFLQETCARLQPTSPAVAASIAVASLLQDRPWLAMGLSVVLTELRECIWNDLRAEEQRPHVRSLVDLASLYLAIVHPSSDISGPFREHRHAGPVGLGLSECLLCVEQGLSDRLQRLMPSQSTDEPAAWMKEAARQAGVPAQLLVRFDKLNDSIGESAGGDASVAGASLASLQQLDSLDDKTAEPANSSAQPVLRSPSPSADPRTRTSDSSAVNGSPVDSFPDVDKPAVQTTTAAATSTSAPPPEPCTVCHAASRDALLLPCYHVSCCFPCGLELMKQGRPCPKCSSIITRTISIKMEQAVESMSLVATTIAPVSGGSAVLTKQTGAPVDAEMSTRRSAGDERSHPAVSKHVQQRHEDTHSGQQLTFDRAGSDEQLSATVSQMSETAAGVGVMHHPPLMTHSAAAPSSSLTLSFDPSVAVPTKQPRTVAGSMLEPAKLEEQIKSARAKKAVEPVEATSAALSTEPAHAASLSAVSPGELAAAAILSQHMQLEAVPGAPIDSVLPAAVVTESVDVTPIASPVSAELPSIPQGPHLVRCRVKTGVVRFTCSACSRVFEGNSSNAHLHMTTHHNVRNVPVLCEDGQVKYRKQRVPRSAGTSDGGASEAVLGDTSKPSDSTRTAFSTALPMSLVTDTSGTNGHLSAADLIAQRMVEAADKSLQRRVEQVSRDVDAGVLAATSAEPADNEQTRKRARHQNSEVAIIVPALQEVDNGNKLERPAEAHHTSRKLQRIDPATQASDSSWSDASNPVLQSGTVLLGWQHRPMVRDFPFPIPRAFIYCHQLAGVDKLHEAYIDRECARCTMKPFPTFLSAAAHFDKSHRGVAFLIVRYDDRSGRWEWRARHAPLLAGG